MSEIRFVIKYNGQEACRFAKARVRWEPEVIGPEEGKIYRRETWTVEGFLVAPQGTNLQTYWVGLQQTLSQQGKLFEVKTFSGSTLLTTFLTHGSLDDANSGPRPMRVEIHQFTGGRAARVFFEIELAKPYSSSPYLGLTWTELIAIDDRFLTTRTVRGSVRLNPNQKIDPRLQLETWFPRLKGFRRTRNRTAQRDASEVLFEIVDTEEYYALPSPIANGQATFEMLIKLDKEGKPQYEKSFSAWFEPPKTADITSGKKATAEMLIALADSRFPQSDCLMTYMGLKEDLWGGRIQVDYAGYSTSKAAHQRMRDDYEQVFAKAVAGSENGPADFGPGGTANVASRSGNPLSGAGAGLGAAGGSTVVFGPGHKFQNLVAGSEALPIVLSITWALEVEHHKVILKPKAAGAADIVQTYANPTMTVTEIGSGKFAGKFPGSLAEIPGSISRGDLLNEFFLPGQPFQDAAGKWFYPLDWIVRRHYPAPRKTGFDDARQIAEDARHASEGGR